MFSAVREYSDSFWYAWCGRTSKDAISNAGGGNTEGINASLRHKKREGCSNADKYLAAQNLLQQLAELERRDEARETLKQRPLAPADYFKTSFRTYSDADAEQHLAFDLYRIQTQEALEAVTQLLAYPASEKAKGSEIVAEDIQDLKAASRLVLDVIDYF